MPDYCSCGAALPPDALFCHKCGKPQREIPVVEPEIQVIEPPPPPHPAAEAVKPLPLNFHNRVAVRIAILMGIASTCLFFLPYLNWIAAGFFAVFFYRRRTGQTFNVGLGVRMGWITGIVTFAIGLLMVALFALLVSAAGGLPEIQAQLKNIADPRAQAALQQVLRLYQNGADLFRFLLVLFVFTTFLTMVGGALGAKMVGQD